MDRLPRAAAFVAVILSWGCVQPRPQPAPLCNTDELVAKVVELGSAPPTVDPPPPPPKKKPAWLKHMLDVLDPVGLFLDDVFDAWFSNLEDEDLTGSDKKKTPPKKTAESRTQSKPDAKPEPKPDAKSDGKPESKTDPRSDPKSEPRPLQTPEAPSEPDRKKPDPNPEAPKSP